jgi:hypothetical protein
MGSWRHRKNIWRGQDRGPDHIGGKFALRARVIERAERCSAHAEKILGRSVLRPYGDLQLNIILIISMRAIPGN